jgi:hypothetical protein
LIVNNEKKTEEMLSCPLCRSKAELNSGDSGFFVCCVNLDRVTDSMYTTEQEAITAWNDGIIAMRKGIQEPRCGGLRPTAGGLTKATK